MDEDLVLKALKYYSGMKAVCRHDDSSWCENCPDGGKLARKALIQYFMKQNADEEGKKALETPLLRDQAKTIVNMIGNIANRPDLRAVQEKQVELIIALVEDRLRENG